MRHAVALLVWLGLFIGGIPACAQGSSAMVLAIRHVVEATGDRISIELNGAHLPKTFMMGGDSPRLVLDFPDCGYSGPSPGVAVGSDLVKRLRVGRHEKPQRKIRLVVDLPLDRKVIWHTDFRAAANVLELVISAAGPKPPAARVGEQPTASKEADPFDETAAPSGAQQMEPVLLRADAIKVRFSGVATSRQESAAGEGAEVAGAASAADAAVDNAGPAGVQQAEPVLLRADGTKRRLAGGADSPQEPVASETAEVVKVESATTAGHVEPLAAEAVQTGQPPLDEPTAAPQPAEPAIEQEETPSVPTGPPVLMNVSFDNAFSQSGEMVLLQLDSFRPPVISTQEKSPPRIFCDFDGASVDPGLAREIATNGRYVEKVEVLAESQRVRVVLDLVPGVNYDLQQVYFKEDNLFVLIVNLLKDPQ